MFFSIQIFFFNGDFVFVYYFSIELYLRRLSWRKNIADDDYYFSEIDSIKNRTALLIG